MVMEEEVKYTSEFDGQTTDEVLKHAKSVKDLTIPSLSNISGFVCIDNEGKAIGMMSKEDIAQVVGGLIGEANSNKDGLMTKGIYNQTVYSDIYIEFGRTKKFKIDLGRLSEIIVCSDTALYSHYIVINHSFGVSIIGKSYNVSYTTKFYKGDDGIYISVQTYVNGVNLLCRSMASNEATILTETDKDLSSMSELQVTEE